jgi:hypothetical protein
MIVQIPVFKPTGYTAESSLVVGAMMVLLK